MEVARIQSARISDTDVEQARIKGPDVADARVMRPQVEGAGAGRGTQDPLLHTRLEMPSKQAAFDVAGTAMAMALAPSSEHPRMTVERMTGIAFSLARMEVDEPKTKPREID